jgi:cytochrome c-type biogenesis protein CcmE
VAYTGILPDLFREGQGIVALGKLDTNGVFQAREVLAKHDEKYMPPEVADALEMAAKGGRMPVPMSNPHAQTPGAAAPAKP